MSRFLWWRKLRGGLWVRLRDGRWCRTHWREPCTSGWMFDPRYDGQLIHFTNPAIFQLEDWGTFKWLR